ncbi:hypothetical protein BKA66DRAFT_474122 [Pyrenochaeta sp. MPI-SDFR-AT-0127]|nr:hypothetical protein BKA66DRAFT_474122 [Pyrenochaeta sp. MPI-SDFR-AT-0127]
MTLPHGRQRFYLDTDTCIAIVHEIETIENRAPPRNDFVVGNLLNEDVVRWQALFGFTVYEAGFELLNYRTERAEKKHIPKTRTLSEWPWQRCEKLGFDRESYDYWLQTVDHTGLLDPKETATWVRYKNGKIELFVMRSVDYGINRCRFAPAMMRQPVVHTVFDWKGCKHPAILLRD